MFYMAVPSESACAEILCQIFKLHPLQEVLRADLVLGDDAAHPLNHSLVITLQAMQVVLKLGPRFCLQGTWHSWHMNCRINLQTACTVIMRSGYNNGRSLGHPLPYQNGVETNHHHTRMEMRPSIAIPRRSQVSVQDILSATIWRSPGG